MHGQLEAAISPVTVFYSYAHEDESLRAKLETHLAVLKRQGLITEWHDRNISAGAEWKGEISAHLNAAHLVLLLVSPDFLASDYCYSIEMKRAMERHEDGDARVIPIILRPSDWKHPPLSDLQVLPRDGTPITRWSDIDEAFVNVAKGIRATLEDLSTSQRSPVPPTPRGSAAPQSRGYPSPVSKDPNRRRMLERVRSTWIKGVLEQSLHGAALIALGLREQSDVLANPWRLVVQEVDQAAHALPTGTHITQVYDDAEGALLILGEPGAGKTTLLLELIRDLLDRAQKDEHLPMPVVFNLSSWARKQPPLTEWLVEELNIRYEVPRRLGQSWVSNEMLLLLLDGLDEVLPAARKECIQAINRYRQEHPLVPVVVCSRNDDYLDQPTQLRLHAAIMVQPLTQEQIDEYLVNAGAQVEALRIALRTDLDLQELATTPLMLSILTLAYQGTPLDEIAALDSLKTRQQQVFDAYVRRMFERRSAETRYTTQQTMQWLAWLARRMKQRGQAIFYLERMQPDWLAKGWIRRLYSCSSRGLLGALFIALIGGVVSGLLGPWTSSLSAWLLGRSSSDPLFPWIHQLFGWALPTLDSLLSHAISGLAIGFVGGLLVGFVGGLLVGLLNTRETEIKPVEVVVWSWRTLPRDVIASLVIGLVGVLLLWLFGRPVGVSITEQVWDVSTGTSIGPPQPFNLEVLRSLFTDLIYYQLINGLGFGLIGGLIGLVSGFSSEKQNEQHLAVPRLRRWHSVRTGVLVGLVDWLVGVPLAYSVGYLLDQPLGGLLHWSVDEPSKPWGLFIGGLIGVASCVLVGGLVFGLINGFSREKLEKHLLVVPNQGIRRSVQNGLFVGLLAGITCMLLSVLGVTQPDVWLFHRSIESLTLGLSTGLVFAPFVGLLVGLFFGGTACIKHVSLRLFLWRMRCIPWNYSRFLDYAAERILLRKVGGGYIFVHRLLLDYFASLDAPTAV